MNDNGLNMFYLGIETGSDLILKKVTKGATSVTMIRAIKKAMDAGYIMSCMIILGLGGKTHSKEHIRGTAEVQHGLLASLAPKPFADGIGSGVDGSRVDNQYTLSAFSAWTSRVTSIRRRTPTPTAHPSTT